VLQVNPGTVFLLLCALLAVGWASGLLRARLEEGRLTVHLWRSRLSLTFELRDTWLLLAFALVLGWSVAAAVEHSAWIPQTEGRLVPAVALAVVLGWLLVVARTSRAGYLLGSLIGIVGGLALITPSPLTGGFSLPAMARWLSDLGSNTNLQLLIGMLSMLFVTGLWTSWWTFRRRNGLVALLPSGIILAVEIINDTTASLVFYTLVWLVGAAAVLLRLNFVDLKYSWRRRRLPHASDTGWAFGEIGVEATVGILLIAFLMPPLSNTDISGMLIPGVVRPDDFHPFGIGAPGNPNGSVGTVVYSDVVRPGSQLKAKPELVMVITGDSPTLYPYWRGAALGGWDGIEWYSLPSTDAIPVRQQPVLKSGVTIPRDDLPADKTRTQVIRDTIHVVVPASQLKETVFGAGELLSVKGQSVSVRGIITSEPSPPGPNPPLVNVAGDNQPIASFDTVDKVLFAHQPQGSSFTYTVTEALPDVDVADLETAGSDYPAWLTPYLTLYYNNQVAPGYSPARDADIAALAHQIVSAAGAKNPYDQAKAIEAWFLAKGRFTYTLAPPPAPAKVRPLDNFLFNTHRGYCQDFSTAMNVMLRLLGIPSRQMTGFSLGSFDVKTRSYSIDSVDAHSWVEVYFPGYGWQPFEPTPDGLDQPVNRPATRADLNAPPPVPSGVARPGQLAGIRDPTVGGGAGSGSSSPFPDLLHPALVALAILAAIALLALLLAVRWLLAARDLPRIWRRLLFLGDRLQVRRRAGDTPQEYADRLALSLPELDPELRSLGTLYTRASFRRGGVTTDELAEARRNWGRVRGRYAGLVARAWREALRNGRVVSAEGAEASENRAPSRHR
jgi:hypothetical protein